MQRSSISAISLPPAHARRLLGVLEYSPRQQVSFCLPAGCPGSVLASLDIGPILPSAPYALLPPPIPHDLLQALISSSPGVRIQSTNSVTSPPWAGEGLIGWWGWGPSHGRKPHLRERQKKHAHTPLCNWKCPCLVSEMHGRLEWFHGVSILIRFRRKESSLPLAEYSKLPFSFFLYTFISIYYLYKGKLPFYVYWFCARSSEPLSFGSWSL